MIPLVQGLMVRDADPATSAWPPNMEIAWRDLEPVEAGGVASDRIDRAIESGKAFRVRLFCGRLAPYWLKERAGTFTYVEPQSNLVVNDMPRWWVPAYRRAYRDLIAQMAERWDGRIPLVFISGAMSYYAEPMLRGLASETTRRNLLAAGYSVDRDMRAQKSAIKAHRAFVETRSGLAYNIYQRLNPDGSQAYGFDETQGLMAFQREHLPGSVIANNSIRSSYIGLEESQSVFRLMAEIGGPRGFQTATIERVGDLRATILWAIEQGAHYVELPGGHDLSVQDLTAYDARLKAVEEVA